MFNLGIRRKIEKLLDIKVFNKNIPRGADLFYDLDKAYGVHNMKTIFDIGANVGQSSLVYKNVFKNADIYAFEPVCSTYQQLAANVDAYKNIHPFNVGLGDETKEIEINIKECSQANSIKDNIAVISAQKIFMMTLEEFLQENAVEKIDFAKIDTEGYEIEVLKGARKLLMGQKISFILLEAEIRKTELHFTPLEAIDSFLKDFGYELFGFYHQQHHYNGRRSLRYVDALYMAGSLLEVVGY